MGALGSTCARQRIAFTRRLGTGFFVGEGFILQRLRGDGMAFVHACGTIIKREAAGQTLRVDTGSLVAFTPGIDYSIERAGNLRSMVFGGEGLSLATLRGGTGSTRPPVAGLRQISWLPAAWRVNSQPSRRSLRVSSAANAVSG